MSKLGGLKKLLDGISILNSQTDGPSCENPDMNDSLKPDVFTLTKLNRYGFPYHATCLALDPVQKLLAIGTDTGAIRICGRPSVEFHFHHESNAPVKILSFLINEGGLVSVCDDAKLHLWSLRQKQPTLIQSLNFKITERITSLHNPFGSKWLYVGTERGNVFMVHIETFHLSGYVISWNHVIDVSCKTHPGPSISIKSNPQDQNKLLLNFESGVCVLWDLRAKKVLQNYTTEKPSQNMTCSSWLTEGKQFMTGHWDGSLSTWNFRNCKKPEFQNTPHATKNGNVDSKDSLVCCPITKLEWLAAKDRDPLIIFSGGMAYGNKNKGLTVMRGRSKSLLLPEQVIDFQCLMSMPIPSELPEPQALFVLLRNEIVVFDLLGSMAPSLPWFTIPYRFDLHESIITCVHLVPQCHNTLLTDLHSLATVQNKDTSKNSSRPWPLNGGQEGEQNQDPAIIITGHVDGSVKIWDATSGMLILCHKFSVARLFERHISRQPSTTSNASKTSSIDQFDDPFAIQQITFCPYGRIMAVTCQSYFVSVFKFSKAETTCETSSINASFCVEVAEECSETSDRYNDSVTESLPESNLSSSGSQNTLTSYFTSQTHHPPLRTVALKWLPGFQPVCLCNQLAFEPMPNITTVALSSSYGLVSFGNAIGVAVVDYIQKVTTMVIMNHELAAPGDWTAAPSNSPKTPVSKNSTQTSLSNDQHVPNGHNVENHKKHSSNRRKERASRMMSVNVDQLTHAKVSKKSSGSGSSKDKEDGYLSNKERTGENMGSIHALTFGCTYTRKGGNLICPALWVGTSLGYTAVVALSIPPSAQQRRIQPVLGLCTGTIIDQRHCVLNITHLDQFGNICPPPFDFWRDSASPNPMSNRTNIQTMNSESTTRAFVAIVTEKQIKVIRLPSLKQFSFSEPVGSEGFIIKADCMSIDSGNCVGCLTTEGSLKIFSLPTLRVLLDIDCGISLVDYRMIRTFTMGNGGEAAFLGSPTEIQKIAFTREKEQQFVDANGCLFTLRPFPEPKPKGFLQSIISSAPSSLDREELFGPKSGNSQKVAAHVEGSGMESLRNQTDTVGGALSAAKEELVKRKQKLGQLNEQTEKLMGRAQQYQSLARALADKYQKKKWYQL